MKRIILLGFFTLSLFSLSFAQVSESCKNIQIESSEDAQKHESCMLETANFILSKHLLYASDEYTAMNKNTLRWINRTMNYTIDINENIVALCKGKNTQLLPVFHASLVKAALSGATNFHREAIVILVDYISNEQNQVKKTGAVKKLLSAYKQNNFSKYYQ